MMQNSNANFTVNYIATKNMPAAADYDNSTVQEIVQKIVQKQT